MKNNTLNKWKSAYEEREITPSVELWDQLVEELDGQQGISQKPSLQWWAYAAAFLLMSSVGTLIFFNIGQSGSGQKKAAPMVTKLHKTPAVPVSGNVPDAANLPGTGETGKEPKIALTVQKNNRESTFGSQIERPIMVADRQADAHEQENMTAKPENNLSLQPSAIPESTAGPLLADGKKQDQGYIHADELLLGREIDRLNESREREEKRFGVFNLRKVVPKVEKVTVLGVKIYNDPK